MKIYTEKKGWPHLKSQLVSLFRYLESPPIIFSMWLERLILSLTTEKRMSVVRVVNRPINFKI